MKKDISIMIGGIQGEGVVSTGINLMKTFSALGYYTYANRNFSSRIKGGNTTITMTISTSKISAVRDALDIILAMDSDTIERYSKFLQPEGVLLYDSELKVDLTSVNKFKSLSVPITSICKGMGALNMKSTSSMAFLGKVLDLSQETLITSLHDRYKKKGIDVINKNLEILTAVYQLEGINWQEVQTQLLPPENTISRAVMIGNEAISLGALVAGCRFVGSYPITPASEIMEYLSSVLPRFGGIMLQVEDEIAAVNAIIGASYAGVRSMTATSGPGISLMQEGIGLSGMAEIPIVIVDAQRAGPSTGLPTKHEQSDLFTVYYGGHGEYPSIILTPSSIEECFYETIRAFDLADIYQCPVILLTDLTLSLAPETIDNIEFDKVKINRGKLVTDLKEDLEVYQRFTNTPDGISPRTIPGAKGGIHHVTGLEHNELGAPNDLPQNRKSMMDKRMTKTLPLTTGQEIYLTINKGNKILFLTFGSTYGVLKEAVLATNNRVDIGKIKMIKPLPLKQLDNLFNKYEKVVIVENNYHGQLSRILKSELGYHSKIRSVVKYDGNPFTTEEIIQEIGGVY